MSIKNTLKKAAGLFIEFNDEPVNLEELAGLSIDKPVAPIPTPVAVPAPAPAPAPAPTMKTVEQVVKDAPGPNLEDIKVQASQVQSASVSAPGGQVNFADIYRHANVPGAAFTAEQALDMINSLPADLPIEVRRQTVRVTMAAMGKATGVDAESVVADASRKLAALDSFADTLSARTTDFISKTNREITELENEIALKKRTIDETNRHLANAISVCETESQRLDDVLEFFSLDIPPSKYAPPS